MIASIFFIAFASPGSDGGPAPAGTEISLAGPVPRSDKNMKGR
jgi:hypothetical protein